MRSFCQVDRDRELNNPLDEPFKATHFTYINRAYRRLFVTEEDRAREEMFKKTRREIAARESEGELLRQEIAAQEERIGQLEQTRAASSGWFWIQNLGDNKRHRGPPVLLLAGVSLYSVPHLCCLGNIQT